ncbi:MAG: sigma-70 family RNA polymerase sigma factor [Kiritimatiellae bacterium]|nr:sigma-70 family RNA polymerase sigma factor [Kiritimatiellia bacterium]
MASEDGRLLLNYARDGDVDSLSALVIRNARWLTAFLRGMSRSDEDVEDAFQETWARVIKSCSSYRGGSVRVYLSRAARSAVIDAARRAGRSPAPLAGDDAAAAEIPDDAPGPAEAFESRATYEEVRGAVRALPEGQREVLLMRFEGGLTFKEISEATGLPIGTVLTRMYAATDRLRGVLGEKK